MRVQPPSGLRRQVPILGGPHAVARDFEQYGDIRQAIGLLPVALHQSLGDRPAQRRLPRRAQRIEAGVLIHVVREAVVQRQGTIRRFELAGESHEGVLALQTFEPGLHLLFVHLHDGSEDGRVEVHALDARGRQQPAIRVFECVHLALDQAAY